MKFVMVSTVAMGLVACSVYQSPGRKFLEDQGIPDAKAESAQANLLACDDLHDFTGNWILLNHDNHADVFAAEGDAFELQVRPRQNQEAACEFHYSSAQEMYVGAEAAVAYTLHHAGLIRK